MSNVNCIVMPFDGQSIEVVTDNHGVHFVSVRSVCLAIGLENSRQQKKLEGDPKFNCVHMDTVAADSKQRGMICIELDHLNGWLFSINSNKVREDIKPRLLAYQKECFDVLSKHFMPRGFEDLQPFMTSLTDLHSKLDNMNSKFDYLVGMDLTVFGNDAAMIKTMIDQASVMLGMTTQQVWGLIRKECDVSSYKQQNRKIINFIKNLLGKGLTLVKD